MRPQGPHRVPRWTRYGPQATQPYCEPCPTTCKRSSASLPGPLRGFSALTKGQKGGLIFPILLDGVMGKALVRIHLVPTQCPCRLSVGARCSPKSQIDPSRIERLTHRCLSPHTPHAGKRLRAGCLPRSPLPERDRRAQPTNRVPPSPHAGENQTRSRRCNRRQKNRESARTPG